MAIKVNFLTGAPTATASGLYQWDYGQVLEIECAEFGSEIMEVHFACGGMTEAIVRPCSFSDGIGTVVIPDQCLEQASNITAWVYKINGTQGHTVKTITLPIVARTRPSKSQDVPTEYINKYGELIEEINEAVEALESGNVSVARATNADEATHATTADSAKNATYATSAGGVTTAEQARAVLVSINAPYCTITIANGSGHTEKNFNGGLYLVTYDNGSITLSGVGYIGKNSGSLNHYSISLGKVAILYDESSGAGAEIGLIYLGENTNPVISNNGTLKFFKIGSIANG